MSFALDLESQTPPKRAAGTDLGHIIQDTSGQIQTYSLLVSSFSNERKLIGTKRDSTTLRAKLDESLRSIESLGEAIKTLISNVNSVVNSSVDDGLNGPEISAHLMMKDRIVGEFNSLQATFHAQAREYHEKKRASALPENQAALETTPLLRGHVQQQQQQQQEVDELELQYHVLLTEERNRQIEQVQDGIREVNSIFKDLGELVNLQGAQLDTVEENILQMSGNAHSADRELTKANEYQRRKNKWTCILLCALCVFVLVMVLAVVS